MYEITNPDISYGFVARRRKRAWIQGARSEGDEGILHNMSNPDISYGFVVRERKRGAMTPLDNK